MYSKTFFRSKLGQASLASIAATTAMVALTTQMNMVAADSSIAQPSITAPISVELA